VKIWTDAKYRRDLAEDAVVAAVIALLVCGMAGILVVFVIPLEVKVLAAWVNATAVVFWIVFLIQRWGGGPRTPVD
jgi:hypothetical protein